MRLGTGKPVETVYREHRCGRQQAGVIKQGMFQGLPCSAVATTTLPQVVTNNKHGCQSSASLVQAMQVLHAVVPCHNKQHTGLLAQAKEGCQAADDAHFDSNQASREGQHDRPLLDEQAQVQAAACCDKEQAQQDASEGADVCFHLPQYRHRITTTQYMRRVRIEAA